MTTVAFKYMNHRGEIEDRVVAVDALEYMTGIGLGYQPGWFLSGICQKKQARRSFALSRIIFDDDDTALSRQILFHTKL
jgi:predicted DNA-binding transcriptional regulator YafY